MRTVKKYVAAKKITAFCAASIMAAAMSFSVYAEEDHVYTREEIIDEYWTDYWSNSLPGEDNPEGSLEYHILETWLNEQYGNTDTNGEPYTVNDWSNYWSIRNAWNDYHDDYTKYWHMNDDEETREFTIEEYDPETEETGGVLYTFKFLDGKWNMIDVNGNTVDTFDPHGGDGSWDRLQNEDNTDDIKDFIKHMNDDDSETSSEDTSSYRTAHPTDDAEEATTQGKPAAAPTSTSRTDDESSAVTASTSVTENEPQADESSPLPYILGGIAIVAAGGAGGYFIGRKKNK